MVNRSSIELSLWKNKSKFYLESLLGITALVNHFGDEERSRNFEKVDIDTTEQNYWLLDHWT